MDNNIIQVWADSETGVTREKLASIELISRKSDNVRR